MSTVLLRFQTLENRHHAGRSVYQWLLDEARALGFDDGRVFRAMAGFGRDGRMHEQGFFELAGEEPVAVDLVGSAEQAAQMLERVSDAGLQLPWCQSPVDSGITAGP